MRKIISSLILTAAAGLAQATTYSNVPSGSAISLFGANATTNYGQTFTGVGGVLQDFTFYAKSGRSGNVDLVIAAWDGFMAVGPALYTSSVLSYAGGESAVGASGINLALNSTTSYIAYLTVAGVPNAADALAFKGSGDNGGLGGAFHYSNTFGVDPLTLSDGWESGSPASLAYTANISAVPELQTYAALLAGLALISVAMRRKRF